MWVLREGGKNTKRAFNAWLKTLWEDITTRTLNWATYFCIVKLRTCNTFFYTSPSSDHVFSPPLYSKDCQGVEIKFVFPVFVPRGRLLYVSTRKSEKIGILVKLDPVNYFTAHAETKTKQKGKIIFPAQPCPSKTKKSETLFLWKRLIGNVTCVPTFPWSYKSKQVRQNVPEEKTWCCQLFPSACLRHKQSTSHQLHKQLTITSQPNEQKTTSNLNQNLNGQKCVFLGLEDKFSYVRSTKLRESLISDLGGDASARSKIWSTWVEEGGRVSSKCFIFWSDQKFNGCRYIGRLSWKHLISILS